MTTSFSTPAGQNHSPAAASQIGNRTKFTTAAAGIYIYSVPNPAAACDHCTADIFPAIVYRRIHPI